MPAPTKPVTYVNPDGKPIDVGAMPPAPPRPRKDASRVYHKGWVAVGVSPERVEEAKAEAKRLQQTPIDTLAWIAKAKAKRVHPKPFDTWAAARHAADVALRCGWHRVEVVELSKGVPPPGDLFTTA